MIESQRGSPEFDSLFADTIVDTIKRNKGIVLL